MSTRTRCYQMPLLLAMCQGCENKNDCDVWFVIKNKDGGVKTGENDE